MALGEGLYHLVFARFRGAFPNNHLDFLSCKSCADIHPEGDWHPTDLCSRPDFCFRTTYRIRLLAEQVQNIKTN